MGLLTFLVLLLIRGEYVGSQKKVKAFVKRQKSVGGLWRSVGGPLGVCWGEGLLEGGSVEGRVRWGSVGGVSGGLLEVRRGLWSVKSFS